PVGHYFGPVVASGRPGGHHIPEVVATWVVTMRPVSQQSRTVILLAAGEGKRMKSALPKVLHPLLGRSLVGHVLAAAAPLDARDTIVVVGVGADRVREHLAEIAPDAVPVVQAEQRGTGHAVRIALEAATLAEPPAANVLQPEAAGTVVVLNGDLPLVRAQTLT